MIARSLWCASAVLLALAGCESTPEREARASEVRRDVVIQFSDTSVEPTVARVEQGGSVAWTSLASSYTGVVSFPASIVGRFTCKELRPDFIVDGDRLVSARPLRGDSESLALPCPLQRGTYPYRIELGQGGDMGAGRELDPMRSLPASLVVE
jgi:hypothetical protein